MKIYIESRTSSAATLRRLLDANVPGEIQIGSDDASVYRSLDPTVLVATVGATGALVGALIGGLFRVLEQAKAARLVIVGAKGGRIELPASATDEMLERAIEAARQLDIEKISLLPPKEN